MQAFTFYASDDKLINRGNEAGKLYTVRDIHAITAYITGCFKLKYPSLGNPGEKSNARNIFIFTYISGLRKLIGT